MADGKERRRAARELWAYFALTFIFTWGIGGVLLLAHAQLERLIGPIGPLTQSWPYYVAVSAPAIVAVVLSLVFGGLVGLKTLFGGLLRPGSLKWIALALFTYPAVLLGWGVIERTIGVTPTIDIHALLIGAPVMLLTTGVLFTDPGPLGEEAGWRGFALPRLLKLFSPLVASLILGGIWLTWHIPAFLAAGSNQAGFNFGWFGLSLVSLTVFMTWIYINTNGNWLLAGIVPHLLFNLVLDARVHSLSAIAPRISLALIAVVLVACLGPTLAGWRRKPDKDENPRT